MQRCLSLSPWSLSAACQLCKEAYICDMARLRQRLQSGSLTSSLSDCNGAVGASTAWSKEDEEEEDEGSVTGQQGGRIM